jgi:type II secretory pathway pseudopilin PulG
MSFVREHKWFFMLIAVSIIVIVLGFIMVKKSKDQRQQEQQQEQQKLQILNDIANQAVADLENTVATSDVLIDDIIPAESLAKVNALNGKIPETGSDDWCELMMIKDGNTWTQEEQSQFAQHCI